MKIKVIFTGGTIGSVVNESGIIGLPVAESGMPGQTGLESRKKYALLERAQEMCGSDVRFDVECPYEILSENLDGTHLTKLIETVREALSTAPDGIIITHGSDTIRYAATMLQLVFGDSNCPIHFVCSQYVLDHPGSNGYANFCKAVEAIREGKKGVFISYRNEGEEARLYRPYALGEHLIFSSDLQEVPDGALGAREDASLFSSYEARFPEKVALPEEIRLLDTLPQLLRLSVYPAMHFPDLSGREKIILLEGYHSGTLPLTASLREFSRAAQQQGAMVVLLGTPAGGGEYETVATLREWGIRCLPGVTPIEVVCRIWLAISNQIPLEKVLPEMV